MKTKLNLNKRFLLLATIFLLIVNSSLGFLLMRQSTKAMRALIANRMLDVSNTAAAMIDGDVLGNISKEDEDTPEYQAILKTLTYYQENIELKYIYCIRDLGNKQFVFSLDPTVEDPGEFGEPIVYTDALYKASLGTAAVDEEPYEDSWGRFYSAYSPVFDSNGRVAGIVAVDFSADWYETQIRNQVVTIVAITVISLIIATVILLFVGVIATNRFHMLYAELNNLSDGIKALSDELTNGEEIEGSELLHAESGDESSLDEVSAIGNRIRSLQKYMGMQIAYVRAQAYRDSLTGLENRTAYSEYVEKLETKIKNKVADFTLAIFDINGLKQINDHEGHDQGDVAIIKTGAEAEKLMSGYVKRYDDLESSDEHHPVMSMGYTEYDRDKDEFFRSTFERADHQMYENKKAYYQKYGNRRNS